MEWPFTGRESVLTRGLGLVESDTGVALLGAAGVGKSRVLHELGERIERTGLARERVMAAEVTNAIPFAPFVGLLPSVPTLDPLVMLGQALDALQRRRSPRGLLLEVDDAHHLDSGSLTLLIRAVTSGLAVVTLTARTGQNMSPDLVALWTNGVMERVELEPLDRATARTAIEGRLGAIDDALEQELWLLSRGNLLLAHEIVEGAVGRSIEKNDDGVWRQTGRLAVSARLVDLLNSRLASLSAEGLRAMELVAVGAPVALDTIKQAARQGLDELQDRGMVRTSSDPTGTRLIRPAHPLFGEILASNLGASRLQAANRSLLEATLETERTEDGLRLAVWQLRSGEVIDHEIAIAGANEAMVRHDPVLAERLVASVGLEDDRAALILAKSLGYQQRGQEAENLLRGRHASTRGLAGEFASARAQNLAFGLGRVEDAREVLMHAFSVADDSGLRSRLLNERALISAIRGDFVDAREATESVLATEESTPSAIASAYVTLTLAQAMTGDCVGLDSIIDAAVEASTLAREPLPLAEHQVRIMHSIGMVVAGRIRDSISLAEEQASAIGPGGAVGPTWLNTLWVPLDTAGKHDAALAAANTALVGYAEVDPFGLEPQVRGMIALSLGQQGDTKSADSLNDLTVKVPAPRLMVWVDRGRAWSLVVQNQIAQALDILVEAGDYAVAGEHFAWGALCYHDATRLGRPDLVNHRLRSLQEMPGARLIKAMISHTEALIERDPTRLEDAARLYAGMGAALLAAETWAQASGLYGSSDQTRAASCEVLSTASLRACENSDTPALREGPGLVSSRERQIALAAAVGLTSPEIASKAYISVRTVDNHLLSVYRKLGIGGRTELRELVAPATAAW